MTVIEPIAPQLSVVIVNFNTRTYLEQCLPALLTCPLSLEIIIVDNDGSAAGLDADYPTIKILPQSENRWYCEGNNIGIRAAQAQYVLLLNPDTIPQPGALEAMLNFMQQQVDYAGVTIQLRYPNGQIQRTGSRLPTYPYLLVNHSLLGVFLPAWQRRLNHWHWYEDWQRDTERDLEVLPGSCLLMRREDIWLNADLWLYFPEDDLAQRFAGRKFRYLTETFITHNEKSVTQSWSATRIYFRDLLIYTRQHFGLPAWGLLWLFSRPLWWGIYLKQRFR